MPVISNKFSIQEVYGCDTPSRRESEVKYVAGERVNSPEVQILSKLLPKLFCPMSYKIKNEIG